MHFSHGELREGRDRAKMRCMTEKIPEMLCGTLPYLARAISYFRTSVRQ